MKKTSSIILKTLGVLSIFSALLFASLALSAYLERAQHGPGLMFADAEIFLFLTVIFSIIGLICLWIGKKIKAE